MTAPKLADARAIVVRNDNWRIALDEALHGIFAAGRRTGPDLLLMFASSAYGDHYT